MNSPQVSDDTTVITIFFGSNIPYNADEITQKQEILLIQAHC